MFGGRHSHLLLRKGNGRHVELVFFFFFFFLVFDGAKINL